MATPKPECIDALLEAAVRLGESPTKAQYEELGLRPASATIIRQMDGWNAAKEAAGLNTNHSRGSRVGPKPEDVTLPDGETWADLSVDQRWHYRNVEWNTRRTLRRRARLRSWINDRKRERGCNRCERSDPACLDFHHLDDVEKETDVGTMVTFGYGPEALEAEMAKCEVLCANCHRKVHYTVPSNGLRAWAHERKAEGGGCSRCEEADPACLDYHHQTDDKDASIARMVGDGRPKAEVRSEIAKCTVVCANCHRKEHYEPPAASDRYDSHK